MVWSDGAHEDGEDRVVACRSRGRSVWMLGFSTLMDVETTVKLVDG